MVQLFPSLSPTKVFPSALILPVTGTALAELSAFMLSCFIESCATATPHSSKLSAKQMAINFCILSSDLTLLSITYVHIPWSSDCQPEILSEQSRQPLGHCDYSRAGLYA